MCFPLVVSLLVQLARDLQDELYPYFKVFFPVLVGMCSTTNVDVIQVNWDVKGGGGGGGGELEEK